MKTLRLFGIMLVTGKPAELDNVEKLANGTHFLTAYGDKRGRKRARKEEDNAHNPDGSPYIRVIRRRTGGQPCI